MSRLTLTKRSIKNPPAIITPGKRYTFKFGKFWGTLLKVPYGNYTTNSAHNGQFTDLDLRIDHPISGKAWCIFNGKILANNEDELREIIQEKITIYRMEIGEMGAFLLDACIPRTSAWEYDACEDE